MRTVLLALISMISFNIAYAQYNIEGVVVGEQSNQPLEFVNVLIVKNSDSVITGSITDAQGKFKLNVQERTYTIKVERFGEMLFSKEIAVNQNINLGKIAVKEVSELSDVTVVGRRAVVEVKPDRLVFNTENTAVGKGGGSAINALKATPGVIVQQKEIGIVGKSAVKVYINNRPIKMSSEELTAYLSGLAAKDIKNIEVITMPGAKYEVQGNTGIINIVLKKTPQNHWKDHLSSGYNRWSGSFFNLRNNFSYSKEKINVSFSVSKDFINTDKIDKIKVYYPSQIWDSDVNPKFVEDNWNTRFGLDYKINPKGVLGVTYSGTFNSSKSSDKTGVGVLSPLGTKIENFETFGNGNKSSDFQGVDVYYDQQLDTLGRKLSVMLDYFDSNRKKDVVFSSTRTTNKSNNISHLNIKNYNAQIDIEHPFKKISFNYGGKISHTKTISNLSYFSSASGTFVDRTSQTSEFVYTENIQAIYVEAQKSFFEKLQAKAGLRLESSNQS